MHQLYLYSGSAQRMKKRGVSPWHELGKYGREEKPRMTRSEITLGIYGIYTTDMSNGHAHGHDAKLPHIPEWTRELSAQ